MRISLAFALAPFCLLVAYGLESSSTATKDSEDQEFFTYDLNLLQEESYPQLEGDLYDNDLEDSSYLTLVSPSENARRVDWVEDIYDSDEEEFSDDKEDSDNPISIHLSLLQAVDNALDRDEDELPEDADDKGDEAADGELLWMLVTTFEDGEEGSGKVIVYPQDPFQISYELVTGLDKPVGVCFDINHEFLYVVDSTYGEEGYIYQFEINYDDDEKFVLRRADYVIIYQGANPYSCSVDAYGNLYFTDATDNTVNFVDYLDLWTGYTNYYRTLYSRTDDEHDVNVPVGVCISESEDLFFVNNEVDYESGVLYEASVSLKGANSGSLSKQANGDNGAWALGVSDDYVFYTTKDGSLWAFDRDDNDETTIKANKFFVDPRGVTYCDGDVYVADYGRGLIYSFEDSEEEEKPDYFAQIKHAYGLYCVSSASSLVFTVALLFSLMA